MNSSTEFNRECLRSLFFEAGRTEKVLIDFESVVSYDYKIHLKNPKHKVYVTGAIGRKKKLIHEFFEATQGDWINDIQNVSEPGRTTLLGFVTARKQTIADDFFKCAFTHDIMYYLLKSKGNDSFNVDASGLAARPHRYYVAITERRIVLFKTNWLKRLGSPSLTKPSCYWQIPLHEIDHLESLGSNSLTSSSDDLQISFEQVQGVTIPMLSSFLTKMKTSTSQPAHKTSFEEEEDENILTIYRIIYQTWGNELPSNEKARIEKALRL